MEEFLLLFDWKIIFFNILLINGRGKVWLAFCSRKINGG